MVSGHPWHRAFGRNDHATVGLRHQVATAFARHIVNQTRTVWRAQFRYGAGQAGIGILVILLLLTVWVSLMVGLVLWLESLWGIFVALAVLGLTNGVAAVLLILALRHRAERQRLIARRRSNAILWSTLPIDLVALRHLKQHKATVAAIAGGLLTAWAVRAILTPPAAEREHPTQKT
jgi:hypothetical protein